MKSPFPIGIASGDAFCNRVNEKKQLKQYIDSCQHVVLLAPRRYGKTSLVTETLRLSSYLFCEMDLLLCATPLAVQQKIIMHVSQLLNQLLPKTQAAKMKLLKLFKNLKPEIVLSAGGQKVILQMPSEENDITTTLSEVLLNLDKAAIAAKKKVVVFMDEFQQVGEFRKEHTLEASIRHALERSQSTSYIFSGSNRHMLLAMFSSKNRPFYRLCTTMTLDRIKENEHKIFIQKHAEKQWKKNLPDDALQRILQITENHSFYVNLVCHHFWERDEFPTIKKVEEYWLSYLHSQKSVISYDIAQLSNNQKIVLAALAQHRTNQPYGQQYLAKTRLTIASQKEAMSKLMLKDFIYEDEQGVIRLMDPAMQAYIKLLLM